VKLLAGLMKLGFPHGEHFSLIANVFSSSRSLAVYASGVEAIKIYIGHTIFSFGVFLIGRALLGAYLLKKRIFDITGSNLFYGFNLYMMNIDTMKHTFLGVYYGRKLSQKRVIYDILMTCCVLHELMYCIDFFIFRIIYTIILMLFDVNGMGKASNHLNHEVVNDTSYALFMAKRKRHPLVSTAPYFDLDVVIEASRSVVQICVEKARGSFSCIGTLIRDSSGMPKLITYPKIFDGDVKSFSVILDGQKVLAKFNNINIWPNGEVCSLNMSSPASLIGLGHSVRAIDYGDMSNMSRVIAVIHDGTVQRIVVLDNFSFKDDSLNIDIDVLPGKSGSPIYGILNDGSCVFIGICVRGQKLGLPRRHFPTLLDDGSGSNSDSEVDPTPNVSLPSLKGFTRPAIDAINDALLKVRAIKASRSDMTYSLSALFDDHGIDHDEIDNICDFLSKGFVVKFSYDNTYTPVHLTRHSNMLYRSGNNTFPRLGLGANAPLAAGSSLSAVPHINNMVAASASDQPQEGDPQEEEKEDDIDLFGDDGFPR